MPATQQLIDRLSQLYECIVAVDERIEHYNHVCMRWTDAPLEYINTNRFYAKEILRYRKWLVREFYQIANVLCITKL